MSKKVAVNPFVLRQTSNSEFSHFEGSWEQLVELVEANLDKAIQGYKPGVLLVPVNPERFYSSVILARAYMNEFETKLKQRAVGEDWYLDTTYRGPKSPARKVNIVVYSHEVLQEDNSASTDAEFEIVSINATPTDDQIPMDPVTMARNFLHRPGGTKGEFTAQQFAESILFWSQHVKVTPL